MVHWLKTYIHSWQIQQKGSGITNWYLSRKKRTMRKRYEESSKDCFNFVLSDDRSTFTLSAKLKAFRSACFSLLLLIIIILLLLLFKTPFKAKTWSQRMIRQEELTIIITVRKNFRAWSNFKNLLRKRAYTRHATGKERSSKLSSRFKGGALRDDSKKGYEGDWITLLFVWVVTFVYRKRFPRTKIWMVSI